MRIPTLATLVAALALAAVPAAQAAEVLVDTVGYENWGIDIAPTIENAAASAVAAAGFRPTSTRVTIVDLETADCYSSLISAAEDDIAMLRAAIAANPDLVALLDSHGVSASSVVGFALVKNGTLPVFFI